MFCSFCGKENVDGARFCSHCGRPLNFEENSESVQVQVPPVRRQAVSASAGGTKSKVTAVLLCLFLGEVGAHKFYLGEQTGLAVLMLVLTLLGFVFLLPLIATCIWALVDLIRLLVMSDAEFDAKYNNR